MSLWQDIETLQKTKTELEEQFNSLNDKAKALAHSLEQMMKLVEQTLATQEERLHTLEAQLKDKDETVSKLEARIAGIEQMLKRPAKEEPAREEPTIEVAPVEPEKQPMEMTVETAASGTQPEAEEPVERQKEDRRRRRWM